MLYNSFGVLGNILKYMQLGIFMWSKAYKTWLENKFRESLFDWVSIGYSTIVLGAEIVETLKWSLENACKEDCSQSSEQWMMPASRERAILYHFIYIVDLCNVTPLQCWIVCQKFYLQLFWAIWKNLWNFEFSRTHWDAGCCMFWHCAISIT